MKQFSPRPERTGYSSSHTARIFAGAIGVAVVLPSGDGRDADGARAIADFAALLRDEQAELALELGAPIRFVATDPGSGPRWLVGPAASNPAIGRYRAPALAQAGHWFDRNAQLLITDAPDLDGIGEALSLLRTIALDGGSAVVAANCADLEAAIETIVTEVVRSYPAFALRGLDWAAICARHVARVRAAEEPLAALQRWLAELHDAHTWVKPRPAHAPLPYALRVAAGRAIFVRVPPGTIAHTAGVRPGDELRDVDATGWWERTAATPHSRPLLTGYRLLSGPIGGERRLVARSPLGELRRWCEAPTPDPPFPLVGWERLASGTGLLRIAAWRGGDAFEAALDAAFAELATGERLIVDLRGNGGGNLVAARAFRDRFLRAPTWCGSVCFSDGGGGLAPPAQIYGEPAPEARRWRGRVRFLTDPLTYSASEDALLGLQGLPHVRIVGEPSGGGSGRPRLLRLIPGMQLQVSTALTYDRAGRCIEGAGIPVDQLVSPAQPAPDAPDRALLAADRDW